MLNRTECVTHSLISVLELTWDFQCEVAIPNNVSEYFRTTMSHYSQQSFC